MEHGTRASYVRGCRCAACTAAERDYQAARRLRLRAAKGAPGSEPDAQAEHEDDALDLPLLEPFGQLPDGRLVLTDAAGALYIASSVASLLEGNDSDEACPVCGLVHTVIDDEATGGDDQQREGRTPTTGTPAAEPANATLHAHQHGPDDAPRYHAHEGGDKPHQHKPARGTVTTTGYRPPKPAPTPKMSAKAPVAPKAAAKATPAPKVPTQATPVAPVRTPAKGARRRGPIVTSAWHAHRVASERDRREQQ